MNAGSEDVRVLFETLDSHGVYASKVSNSLPPNLATMSISERRAAALASYTTHRAPDAAAINALALQNYREMRADVVSLLYRARKAAEETLSWVAPSSGWQTQYRRVSFTNQRYSDVVRVVRRQGQVLLALAAFALGGGGWVLLWVLKWQRRRRGRR